ncbi:hypothetical protein NE237_006430 [Protea cynaroides]|uniref:Uncharacterized protein n=1 Tax=Protea cynaroides TaxID=273540 RepID=A0A9Q0KMH2_9MAGN|nr:hypothetical protein NE237_006430 [Protea cynaroides]
MNKLCRTFAEVLSSSSMQKWPLSSIKDTPRSKPEPVDSEPENLEFPVVEFFSVSVLSFFGLFLKVLSLVSVFNNNFRILLSGFNSLLLGFFSPRFNGCRQLVQCLLQLLH